MHALCVVLYIPGFELCADNTISDPSGRIYSPTYSAGQYSNDLDCTLTYTFDVARYPAGSGKTVSIYVNDFFTESNDDFLIIADDDGDHEYDGDGSSSSSSLLIGQHYFCN